MFQKSVNNGIIPRAVEYLLKKKEEAEKNNIFFKLSCSLLEIYNDELRDLLYDDNNGKKILQIMEIDDEKSINIINKNNNNKAKEPESKVIYIQNLEKIAFTTYLEAMKLLAKGKNLKFNFILFSLNLLLFQFLISIFN